MTEENEKIEKPITYEDFEAYHHENPGLENTEYYEQFPKANKSTLRSWKTRAMKSIPEPIPGKPPTAQEEHQKHYIQLLMTQSGSKESEFEGVDMESKILILKNRLKDKKRPNNANILPSPMPVGQNTKEFGIDQYIDFDLEKGEIRMEIPMSKLMNPVENEIIRQTKGV